MILTNKLLAYLLFTMHILTSTGSEPNVDQKKNSSATLAQIPKVIYFQKPAGWANAKIYYWNVNPSGSMTTVTWPGVDMLPMGSSCNWYYFYLPAGVSSTNLIFNCGSNACQTGDLSRSTTGYYINGTGWSDTPPSGFCGNPAPFIHANPAGPYNALTAFDVTITVCDNSDLSPTFRYTTDGSTPTLSSASGTNGLVLNVTQNTILKVIGVDASGAVSPVYTHNYTLGPQPPLTVYFKKPSSWTNAKIHYWNPTPSGSIAPTTWDGVNMIQNQPGCSWYHFKFPASVDCINLIFNNGGAPQTVDLSRCDNGYYILDTPGPQWLSEPPSDFCSPNAAPILTVLPNSGGCSLPTSLNISANDPDGNPVTIRYTLDGSDPNGNSPIWVPGTSPPSTNFTLKVRAYDDQGGASSIETRVYTNTNSAPSHLISPQGPITFNSTLNVQITADDDCGPNATIYYTTNGTTPTTTSSSGTNNVILYLTQTTTVKYFVRDVHGNSSPVQSHTYSYDPNFGCGTSNDNYFTWDNATMYFAVTDRFRDGNPSNNVNYGRQSDVVGGFHGGDLAGITQKITEGYFDSLGVDAIWITPPIEQIHGNVPGWGMVPEFQRHYGYHGYYALDWTELDANMGTRHEFQAMIDSAHAHGIRIVMDVVMNHTGYDTPQDMTEFGWTNCTNWWGSQWIRKDDIASCAPCGGGDLTSCLAGLPDILTESTTNVSLPPVLLNKWDAAKETQEINELNTFFTNTGLPRTPVNHIVKWLTDWVREYGIDAFRLDTYKHIELQHWGTLKTQAEIALAQWKAANPSKKLDDNPFWMVGENYGSGITRWSDAINIGKTDALINFNFQNQAPNTASMDNIYSSYASVANPDPTWNFLSYISSHDTKLSNRNNLIEEGTNFLLLPGAVQIYYGDETKRLEGPGPGDQPTRSFMNWNSIDQNVLNHWKKIGQFRKRHPSIGAGSHTKLLTSPYTFKRTLARSDAQDEVIIVVGASGNVTVNVSSIPSWTDGTLLKNAYSGQTATVMSGSVTFNAGSNGVILIENPNPVILPTIAASPLNNAYNPSGHTVCLNASSIDCSPVTLYYTFDLNAPTSNLSTWALYNGCFTINETKTFKAIAINNSNPNLKSDVVVLTYYTEIPDMNIYYRNTNGYSNVFLHSWNATPANANNGEVAWPGRPMTLVCNNNTPSVLTDDWYVLKLPATQSANLIFSCGSNTCQTANLSSPGSTSFYDAGTWSTITPASYCNDCKMVTNTANSGNGSMRYALGCAVPGSLLQFDPGLNNQTLIVTSPISIDKDITISTANNITINGNSVSGSIFDIIANKRVVFTGFQINCASAGVGRCITNNGILTLDNVQFFDPVITSTGNAIQNQGNGQIIIKNNVLFRKSN